MISIHIVTQLALTYMQLIDLCPLLLFPLHLHVHLITCTCNEFRCHQILSMEAPSTRNALVSCILVEMWREVVKNIKMVIKSKYKATLRCNYKYFKSKRWFHPITHLA